MGRSKGGYSSAAVCFFAASLLASSLTACFRPGGDDVGGTGGKAAAKGLNEKLCIQVNADQDSGPYSLFDIPPQMIETGFIEAVQKAKPKWKIYAERGEQACEANVFVDVKGLSYSIDRMQSYDTVHTTLGVGAGMSVYIPGYSEQPIANVAVSDSVPAAAKLLVSALEQAARTARSPERPRSGAKQAEEGKFCYSLSAVNRDRYEDLAQNFYHTSQNRIFTNPDGYKPSENCIPDFYVSGNDVEIRSSSGIEGQYGVLVLRVPGETRSRIYLATGPGHTAALVRNINEMGRVLGSLERGAEKSRTASRSWTDEEIRSVLETIVSTSAAYHAVNSEIDATDQRMRILGVGITQSQQQERRRLQQQLEAHRAKRYDTEKAGSEAINRLHAAMISDAGKVRRLAASQKGKLGPSQRQMISEMMQSFTDVERIGKSHSPFLQDAHDAWRKPR